MRALPSLFAFAFALSGCTTFRWQDEAHPRSSIHTPVGARRVSSVWGARPGEAPAIIWPVKRVRITQEYRNQTSGGHFGIDIAGKRGARVLAAHDGWVIYTGSDFRGYGKLVMLDSGNGWTSLYSHLDGFNVKQGSRVKRGDLLGSMGSTGNATGVHVHFELRKEKRPVDPLAYLP